MNITIANLNVEIDEIDLPLIERYKWYQYPNKNNQIYIGTFLNGRTVLLHRLILNAPSNKVVDHIDKNMLNNKRNNLRLCSQSQNMMNQRKQLGTTSKYKGVSFKKATGKWFAQIRINGKQKHLGTFTNEIDAAKQYNVTALELFGEFALLNEL